MHSWKDFEKIRVFQHQADYVETNHETWKVRWIRSIWNLKRNKKFTNNVLTGISWSLISLRLLPLQNGKYQFELKLGDERIDSSDWDRNDYRQHKSRRLDSATFEHEENYVNPLSKYPEFKIPTPRLRRIITEDKTLTITDSFRVEIQELNKPEQYGTFWMEEQRMLWSSKNGRLRNWHTKPTETVELTDKKNDDRMYR